METTQTVKILGRFIVADPKVCHGQPTFRGPRIFVADVLYQVARGLDWETRKEIAMTLPIPFVAQPPPIQADDAGVLRVGGTRVRLETVIKAFNSGSTAEEILLKYPSLNLTDIYAVITYYLWSRGEVDAYMEERHRQEEAVRRENEVRFPSAGVRERLRARRARQT